MLAYANVNFSIDFYRLSIDFCLLNFILNSEDFNDIFSQLQSYFLKFSALAGNGRAEVFLYDLVLLNSTGSFSLCLKNLCQILIAQLILIEFLVEIFHGLIKIDILK